MYGKLEVVSSLQQADISIVVARGADSLVAELPMSVVNPDYKGELSQTTAYLIVKDPGGLKVLWTKVVPVITNSNTEAYSNRFEAVMGELEKRLKARPRN